MELAFIVGAVLGGLLGGLYMRHLMTLKAYERGVEENRRIQRLLDDQYKIGKNQGRLEAENELREQNSNRDNMLVTAGSITGRMDNDGVINAPIGGEGDDRVTVYITNVVNNYIKTKNNMPFDEYIETLLTCMFGRRGS